METSHRTFQYEALITNSSIRILIINPGQPGSDLHCNLVEAELRDCRDDIYEHYTALSYVWGDASLKRTIFVNDARFEVTVNLAAALEDLRDHRRPLRLWADAVCIDQWNIPERNAQVALMGKIYSFAQQTIVYLGNSNEAIESIFNDLRDIYEDGEEPYVDNPKLETRLKSLPSAGHTFNKQVSWRQPPHIFISPDSESVPAPGGASSSSDRQAPSKELINGREGEYWNEPHLNTFFEQFPLLKRSLTPTLKETSNPKDRNAALLQLINDEILLRPWFKRVWVYQELVLSRMVWVQCGRTRITWDLFCAPIPLEGKGSILGLRLQNFQLLAPMREARWRMVRRRYDSDTQRPRLFDLLLARRGCYASDVRDLIYGHLAIAGITDRMLSVNYSKNVTEVFQDATHFIIKSHKSYGILLHVEVREHSRRRFGLPSWVPDYSLSSLSYLDPLYHGSIYNLLDEINFVSIDYDPSIFIFPRAIYAIVEITGPIVQSYTSESKLWEQVLGLFQREVSSSEAAGIRPWSLVDFDSWYPGNHIESKRGNPLDIFRALLTTASERNRDSTNSYATGIGRLIHGRQIARLKGGGLAIVPASTVAGDVIYSIQHSFQLEIESPLFIVLKPIINDIRVEDGRRTSISDTCKTAHNDYKPYYDIRHFVLKGEALVDTTRNNNFASDFHIWGDAHYVAYTKLYFVYLV